MEREGEGRGRGVRATACGCRSARESTINILLSKELDKEESEETNREEEERDDVGHWNQCPSNVAESSANLRFVWL